MGLGGTLAHTATAPVRLSLSAGELALEVALGIVRGTRRALQGDHDASGPAQPSWPAPPPPPRPAPRRPASPSNGASTKSSGATHTAASAPIVEPPPPVPAAEARGDAVPVIPPPPGAKEVDDAPVPVAEFGEEGAEEDAGAEVRIDPPWEGYDDMIAAQVQDRLADANREVVAAVALYEGMKRDRRSVARAADRRLRALINQPGA
jgi:hypothetical protein